MCANSCQEALYCVYPLSLPRTCEAGCQLDSCWRERLKPDTVFTSSMAMVMGPTPPGTGVMYEATSFTSSNFTSPTSL